MGSEKIFPWRASWFLVMAALAAGHLAGCATTAEPDLRARYVTARDVPLKIRCKGAEPKTLAVVVGASDCIARSMSG